MRKLFVLITIFIMFTIGCAGIQLRPVSDDCIDPTQYPDSVILQNLDSPCQIHRVLGVIAKTGVAMENYTAAEFHLWVEEQVKTIKLAKSLSAKTVKDVLHAHILELNTKAGLGAFIVSETFLVFDDSTMFVGDDLEVIILALRDIDRQVQAMAAFM